MVSPVKPNSGKAGVAMFRFFESEAFRNGAITVLCLVLLLVFAPRFFCDHSVASATMADKVEGRRALEQQILDSLS